MIFFNLICIFAITTSNLDRKNNLLTKISGFVTIWMTKKMK